MNDVNWICHSLIQSQTTWENKIPTIIAPRFYSNDETLNLTTNHTDINSLNNDELTIRILIKHFHHDLHKSIFDNKETQLSFIINDNVQDTFLNIFKVFILRFLGVSFVPISDQAALDKSLDNELNKLNKLKPLNRKPYHNEVLNIIYEIQQKNISFFSNGKDFIDYYHCNNSNSKITARRFIIEAAALFNKIK